MREWLDQATRTEAESLQKTRGAWSCSRPWLSSRRDPRYLYRGASWTAVHPAQHPRFSTEHRAPFLQWTGSNCPGSCILPSPSVHTCCHLLHQSPTASTFTSIGPLASAFAPALLNRWRPGPFTWFPEFVRYLGNSPPCIFPAFFLRSNSCRINFNFSPRFLAAPK